MKFLSFLALCCFAFWGLVTAAEESVSIRMMEKATVVGPKVSLGDVADLIGKNNAILSKLRRLDLGMAAPAGRQIKIKKGYVKIALRREGYSDKDFVLSGAETTGVLTDSQQFSTAELLASLRTFVTKAVGAPPEDVDVQLSGLDKKITLPAGDVRAEFRPPLSGNYEGTVFLTTELSVNGHSVKVLPLRVKVEISHPVVVTKRNIEKGDKFTTENVVISRRPTSAVMRGSIGRLEDVLGRSAAAPIPPGTVVRMTEIFDPPLIKQGSLVQAVVRKANVEITVEARAVENGKVGDRIRVENTESHKVLKGKVLNEKTVLVDQDAL